LKKARQILYFLIFCIVFTKISPKLLYRGILFGFIISLLTPWKTWKNS